jgi:Lhr-like helicase
LIFADSRSRVETIASGLRDTGIRTFVSHSSVSVDERRQAEAAFAVEPDCVIVATSTLELGLDVGDLDRVVQVGAPPSVASFIQRMGRTGRRPGTTRNFLFLATDDEELLADLAIVLLWREGIIEPLTPPACPAHIYAQQVMALVLQESGITRPEIDACHEIADLTDHDACRKRCCLKGEKVIGLSLGTSCEYRPTPPSPERPRLTPLPAVRPGPAFLSIPSGWTSWPWLDQ